MDFGDIITVLVYIMLPLVFASKKKSGKKGKTDNRAPGSPPGRATGKGLMDRLEQMVNEMEKKMADTNAKRLPGQRPMPTEDVPMVDSDMDIPDDRTVDWQQVYIPSESVGQQVDIQQLYTGSIGQEPKTDTGFRDQASKKEIDKVPGEIGGIEAPSEKEWFFDKNDIVKGIILSEVLQPPKALRRSRRHPV
jgi:hypothetical protein